MRYRDLLLESQRTLYHGTLIANLPGIMRDGLVAQAGPFTSQFYAFDDEDELDHLVFAANKSGLNKCVSAIYGYLRLRDIPMTLENFYRYGALCVIRNQEDSFETDETSWNPPTQVEPGDYYSHDDIIPDYILVRQKLRAFLTRHKIDLAR